MSDAPRFARSLARRAAGLAAEIAAVPRHPLPPNAVGGVAGQTPDRYQLDHTAAAALAPAPLADHEPPIAFAHSVSAEVQPLPSSPPPASSESPAVEPSIAAAEGSGTPRKAGAVPASSAPPVHPPISPSFPPPTVIATGEARTGRPPRAVVPPYEVEPAPTSSAAALVPTPGEPSIRSAPAPLEAAPIPAPAEAARRRTAPQGPEPEIGSAPVPLRPRPDIAGGREPAPISTAPVVTGPPAVEPPPVGVSIGTVEIVVDAPARPADQLREDRGFEAYHALRNYEDWD